MADVLLSIDYDFFWREEASWDFGHSESGGFMEEIIWSIRTSGFPPEISLQTEMEKGVSPGPEQFWGCLEKMGFDLSGAHLTASNSHAYAAKAFLSIDPIGEVGRIVNFDAHHDLGYPKPFSKDFSNVRKMWRKGTVEAGSWLGLLMVLHGYSVDIVYPTWKGIQETKPSFKETRKAKLHVFDGSVVEGGRVVGLHIAKSPGWSPPWGDDRFISFVHKAERLTGNKVKIMGENPLKVRSFSMDNDIARAFGMLSKRSA